MKVLEVRTVEEFRCEVDVEFPPYDIYGLELHVVGDQVIDYRFHDDASFFENHNLEDAFWGALNDFAEVTGHKSPIEFCLGEPRVTIQRLTVWDALNEGLG